MKIAESFTLFDIQTGRLLAHLRCDAEQLTTNVRSGQGAYPGMLDLYAKKIDVDVWRQLEEAIARREQLVDAGVSADQEADRHIENLRQTFVVDMRSELNDTVTHEARQTITLRRIAEIESGQQRSVRELLLNPGDVVALQRLQEIDLQIEALRAALEPP